MSFIGALGYNTFDKEIDDVIINTSNHILDTSNVISNHILDTSNVISNYILDKSNIISSNILYTSNYTSNVSLDTSNYTGRINQELSDRIGFPASLFPIELPTGVHFPLKQQEIILADVGKVVGLHTIAIAGIEEQIIALVGSGGIIGIITGGAVGTALTAAADAKNKANEANNKVNNLITSTTTDKSDTSNYILNTSNNIIQYLEILPYEKLSIPLKDGIGIGFIIPPITSEHIIDIDDDYKYIAFTHQAYSTYRFRIIRKRQSTEGLTQYSEIDFFNTNGENMVPISAVASTTPNIRETGPMTIDNNVNTKWLGSSNSIWVVYTFTTPFVLSYYEWMTANDTIGRDPVHWVMEIMEGDNWVILDEINYTDTPNLVTTARFAKVGTFNINQITQYTIDFPEETEVQLLLLDNSKYVETDPSLFSGIANITVGTPSVFNTITTNTNATVFNTGYISTITGTSITYNSSIVIIKYKYTKPIIIQVPNEGYLNYKLTGWEVSDIVGDTSNLIQDTSNYTNFTFNLLAEITDEQLEHTSNYVISTSNILESNINTKIQNNSNLLTTDTNLKIFNTSNYILSSIQTKGESTSNHITYTSNVVTLDTSNYITLTSNILANADTLIQNELNILENILLPTGKTFLDNNKKTLSIGYKDRNTLNYPAIANAFIIPLKQVDKVVDDNNAISVLNYIIYRPFLYVFANILQVDDTYSMVRGVVVYLLDNNNTTFGFTKKLSITNGFNTLYNLYDIGDNSLSYTRTANNLNLTFKQQTTRDFLTTNIYLNNPSLTESFTISTVFGIKIGTWNIPNDIFTNWNEDPRKYFVTDIDTSIKMNISNGKEAYFFFDASGGYVRYIKDFRFVLRMPYNLNDLSNDANPNNLWYYYVDVTYFGEDGVRTTASYNRVFNGAGDADVFIVNVNKRKILRLNIMLVQVLLNGQVIIVLLLLKVCL